MELRVSYLTVISKAGSSGGSKNISVENCFLLNCSLMLFFLF